MKRFTKKWYLQGLAACLGILMGVRGNLAVENTSQAAQGLTQAELAALAKAQGVSGTAAAVPRGNFKCSEGTECACVEWCDAPTSASPSGTDWGTVCRVVRGCNKYTQTPKMICASILQDIGCAHHDPAVVLYEDESL